MARCGRRYGFQPTLMVVSEVIFFIWNTVCAEFAEFNAQTRAAFSVFRFGGSDVAESCRNKGDITGRR